MKEKCEQIIQFLKDNFYYILAFLTASIPLFSNYSRGFYAIVAIVLIYLNFKNPNFGISTILFAVIFTKAIPVYILNSASSMDYFFACLFLGFSLKIIFKKQKIIKNRLIIPLSALLILSAISVLIFSLINMGPTFSITRMLNTYRFLEIIVFMLICASAIDSKEAIKKHLISLILIATIASLYGAYQSTIGYEKSLQQLSDFFIGDILRISSFFGHPTHFGPFLAMILPILIITLFYYLLEDKKNFAKLIGLLLLTAFIFVILIFTFCRAAILSLILALAIGGYIGLKPGAKRRWWILLIIIALLSFGIDQLTAQRYNEVYTLAKEPTEAFNLYQRILAAETAINIIKDRPLLGIGGNQFLTYSKVYAPPGTDKIILTTHPHNTFLMVGVQYGIIVALIFMVLVGLILYKNISLSLKQKDTHLLISLVAILAYIINSFFNHLFDNRMEMVFAFFLSIPLIYEKLGFGKK